MRLAAAAVLAVILAPALARAQVAGSVSVQSDYRLRGVSLTEGRPAATLDLSYDFARGGYLGGSAVWAAAPGHGIGPVGHIVYGGYAWRLDPARTLDLGLSDTHLTSYSDAPQNPYGGPSSLLSHRIHYDEVYAAISNQTLRLAVQYSPNYIAPHARAFYFDLTASARPAQDWRIFAHAGFLDPSGSPAFHSRFDWRAGVARAVGPASLRLALTSHSGTNPAGQNRTALIAGADVFF